MKLRHADIKSDVSVVAMIENHFYGGDARR